jgi:hypothetical protein
MRREDIWTVSSSGNYAGKPRPAVILLSPNPSSARKLGGWAMTTSCASIKRSSSSWDWEPPPAKTETGVPTPEHISTERFTRLDCYRFAEFGPLTATGSFRKMPPIRYGSGLPEGLGSFDMDLFQRHSYIGKHVRAKLAELCHVTTISPVALPLRDNFTHPADREVSSAGRDSTDSKRDGAPAKPCAHFCDLLHTYDLLNA